jgi:hypothetical protein
MSSTLAIAVVAYACILRVCEMANKCEFSTVCMCVCVCVCIYIYTHTHTHTHGVDTNWPKIPHCVQMGRGERGREEGGGGEWGRVCKSDAEVRLSLCARVKVCVCVCESVTHSLHQ